jgi:hypothetical protein
MKRTAFLLSATVGLGALSLALPAHSDIAKKRQVSQRQTPTINPKPVPDVLAITNLQVGPGAQAGVQVVTLEITNKNASSASWIDWQLKAKSSTQELFLGVGSITTIHAGQKHTLTAEFVPNGQAFTIEASVSAGNPTEANGALSNNTKVVALASATPSAALQVADLNPTSAQGAGATHLYTPRAGMTGCTMAQAPQGTNALSVNMTCTTAGAGEVELFKTFTLKQGWKVNGVAVGSLGGGTVVNRHIPLAGSNDPRVSIGITGGPGQSPVLFVRVELVGPVNTSPY